MLYENGKKIDEKEKRKQDKLKKKKKRNEKKMKKKKKEEKKKRIQQKKQNKNRSHNFDLQDQNNSNLLGDENNRDPLGEENKPDPLGEDRKTNKLPELDKKGNPLEEENKGALGNMADSIKKTADTIKKAVKTAVKTAKKGWKWFRRARRTGYLVSILSSLAVPLLILFVVLFLVAGPIMAIILPSGAYVALEGSDGSTETSQKADDSKDSGKVRNNGDGAVLTQTEKELIKGSVYPVEGGDSYITSMFGMRNVSIGSSDHKGVDIGTWNKNLDIVAYQDGEVITSVKGCVAGSTDAARGCGGGFGNYVVVKHSDNYISYYAHMHENMSNEGDKVKAGDILGKVGTTGSSSGEHLHFEVRYSSSGETHVSQDPYKFLSQFKMKYKKENGTIVDLN